jgi:hypothetical protein
MPGITESGCESELNARPITPVTVNDSKYQGILAEFSSRIEADGDRGQRVSRVLRRRLEHSIGRSVPEVTIHTDAWANRLVASLDADAVCIADRIYFKSPSVDFETDRDLRLLGHEMSHAASAPTSLRNRRLVLEDDPWVETNADTAGALTVAGRVCTTAVPAPSTLPGTLTVRRHASWEHRILGDVATADLHAIANNLPARQQVLQDLRDFLFMWHQNPQSVTQKNITDRYPYIRTLQLQRSGLLVTYGELNTLPDYLADSIAMDALPANILLPILQAVRQEGYNKVQGLLNSSDTAQFQGSVAMNTGWNVLDLLLETQALDDLTANVGPSGTNHYTGLVGRNACHFAPYSWYRWQASYTVARSLAQQAWSSSDPRQKGELTRKAWVNLGYADHFLEDSFAAGHLINKTLIMQWFVEWVADTSTIRVADWDYVKRMTSTNQPGPAAFGLYDTANPGVVRDPQTAEEQTTLQARMNVAGVRPGPGDQLASYLSYIQFLNSTVVQSASGVLHDFFNAQSLWAASANHTDKYQLWGDDTMLNGGLGVDIASETAHASQNSINEILRTGTTDTTVQMLLDSFPTQVSSTQAAPLQPLKDWNLGLRQQANQLFEQVHYYLMAAMPRIGKISIDQVNPPTAPFACPTPGENSFATSSEGLHITQQVSINGSTDLSSCMKANDGGCVYGIALVDSPVVVPWTNWRLTIDGQGPSGWASGSMYLRLWDRTGTPHEQYFFSSDRHVLDIDYNSDDPTIVRIEWSDTAFGGV